MHLLPLTAPGLYRYIRVIPVAWDHRDWTKTRLVYNDVITGSDMETWIDHLDTRIDEFDPQRLNFNVPQTNISGVAARIYQVKPLARPEPEIKDMIEARQPSPLQLAFNQVNLENFRPRISQ